MVKAPAREMGRRAKCSVLPQAHISPGRSAFERVEQQTIGFMSQHRSLRASAKLGAKRNVLKRFERIELLKKRGLWKDGDRITGLPKTKVES